MINADNDSKRQCVITVLVCTYNPNPLFLDRCLAALQRQTLDRNLWELLLIDNCSSTPVRERFEVSWHEAGRHLTAVPLGKTHAIKMATREAKGSVLLVVDDDNLLSDNYLEQVHRIMTEYPFLGVVGGNNKGEFEQPPPPWAERYFQLLALGSLGDSTLYSCAPDKTYIPPGAGMAIRKSVVEEYLKQIANDSIRQALDPVGEKLSRSGDIDMAMCAWDLKLAKGFSPKLILTHIIPNKRLRVSYLSDLLEESLYCDTLLQLIRGMLRPDVEASFLRKVRNYLRWRISVRHLTPEQYQIERAGRRGMQRAHRSYRSLR